MRRMLAVKFQTKTSFNVKDNVIVAKYRKDKSDDWKCFFTEGDQLSNDIQHKLANIEMDNYVQDKKETLKKILS